VTVFPKPEKNNMLLDEEGKVTKYDNKRDDPNLRFIDVGYMLADKRVLHHIDGSNVSFSEIIKRLAGCGELYGFVNQNPYYSLTDLERMRKAEEYLSEKKIILLDRDGVINVKAQKGEYITKPEEFKFIPGVLEFMEKMSGEGYSFVIITNQAGVARGKFTADDLDRVHQFMLTAMAEKRINVLKIYICPHHWEEKCFCRKPNPGMFLQASKDFQFRLDHTFFIGDDERDCLAAYHSNCRFIMYDQHYDKSYLEQYHQQYGCWPELFASDLNRAAQHILKEEVESK
jgi:D-glycero-D-manno-heptose 1,7-bisphosphate phosphatase